jgi:maltose alpha-D-glucosyltransferase/alpha-amylase
MGIHMEDRLPLVDIFAQTPKLHAACQWALFLRNHDELTLEMVTDEERDYMYRAYAQSAAMRINLGIRRRLAPLVGNNRRKMELLNGLLLSLPGTPVLYYGDEIGMGDNVYLGDRNGVRTPMQWSMDRNAGFSRATPQRLILPIVIDPEYHYESLNVENQQANPTSLLWWTKRLIALRKRFPAFGRGTIEFLSPSNPCVLAYVRSHGGSHVLVVANLSRFAQYVELDLPAFAGATPVELFGKTRFPAIGAAPYLLTLGPHAFYWFALDVPGVEGERVSSAPPTPITATSVEVLLSGDDRPLLEEPLRAFLDARKLRPLPVRAAHIDDAFRFTAHGRDTYLLIVRTEWEEGQVDLCAVPVAFVEGAPKAPPSAVVAYVETQEPVVHGHLVDALDDPDAARALFESLGQERRVQGAEYELAITKSGGPSIEASDVAAEPRKLGRERDKTMLRFGDRFVLRVMRLLPEGLSPELELGRFLAQKGPGLVPPLVASMELRAPRMDPVSVAMVQGAVPNAGTAWDFTVQELGRFYERALARNTAGPPPHLPSESPLALVTAEPPPHIAEMIGSYRDDAVRLGRRAADLHVALASSPTDPEFAPEPYSTLYLRSKYQSLRTLMGTVLRLLRERLPSLSPRAKVEAERLLAREAAILATFEPLIKSRTDTVRIRVHGNLHLGHVLYAGKDFTFTGLDGMRQMRLSERRRKRSPLVDVTSLVVSIRFAALKVLFDPSKVREADAAAAQPWAMHWAAWSSAALLRGYLEHAAGADIVPADRDQLRVLYEAFIVQRELHQLRGLLEERSDAVTVALFGLSRHLG